MTIKDGTWAAQDCFKVKPFVCEPFPTPPPATYDCGDGWVYYQPTHSCYGLNNPSGFVALDWASAEKYCENEGGHLASVHSDGELHLLHCMSFMVLEMRSVIL